MKKEPAVCVPFVMAPRNLPVRQPFKKMPQQSLVEAVPSLFLQEGIPEQLAEFGPLGAQAYRINRIQTETDITGKKPPGAANRFEPITGIRLILIQRS